MISMRCCAPRVAAMMLGFIFLVAGWPDPAVLRHLGKALGVFGMWRLCRLAAPQQWQLAPAGWSAAVGDWKGFWGGGDRQAASSGNHAFDEYRAETLRRLEEEQKEFSSAWNDFVSPRTRLSSISS